MARSALIDAAAALNRPPYTLENVATAIADTAIALVKLKEVDHEHKALDIVIASLRAEMDRRATAAAPDPRSAS